MYRPTVRYRNEFKTYVDGLFNSTHLDRNQIIRAALFYAAYSNTFKEMLSAFQKKDVPLPSPPWNLDQETVWMDRGSVVIERGGRDVNVNVGRTAETKSDNGSVRWEQSAADAAGRNNRPIEGRTGQIQKSNGGIRIKIS